MGEMGPYIYHLQIAMDRVLVRSKSGLNNNFGHNPRMSSAARSSATTNASYSQTILWILMDSPSNTGHNVTLKRLSGLIDSARRLQMRLHVSSSSSVLQPADANSRSKVLPAGSGYFCPSATPNHDDGEQPLIIHSVILVSSATSTKQNAARARDCFRGSSSSTGTIKTPLILSVCNTWSHTILLFLVYSSMYKDYNARTDWFSRFSSCRLIVTFYHIFLHRYARYRQVV